ncbi:Type-2 restriction enzyme EcoRII [compost metagenome]
MPTTVELAQTARRQYLTQNGLPNLNPYKMDKPGDALRAISRNVEYEIFKDLQIKIRSIELIRLILGDDPAKVGIEKVLRAIVLNFSKIDAMLLSAAQQRKSRAGYSFEHHIEMMMKDGGIPFDKQVVLEAKKRPDFILPSQVLYKDTKRSHVETLVLSAKTTLRERWKQVGGEIRNCDLFLATVDENIAQNAIRDMKSQGISLVVPESLKNSDMTDYKSEPNVLSFRTFFDVELCEKREGLWKKRGYLK